MTRTSPPYLPESWSCIRIAFKTLFPNSPTVIHNHLSLTLSSFQIKSIIGDKANTTEFLLPILLDTAKLIHNSDSSNKEMAEVKKPQILRRSFIEGLEDFDSTTQSQARHRTRRITPPRTLFNITVKDQNNINRTDNNTSDQNDVSHFTIFNTFTACFIFNCFHLVFFYIKRRMTSILNLPTIPNILLIHIIKH